MLIPGFSVSIKRTQHSTKLAHNINTITTHNQQYIHPITHNYNTQATELAQNLHLIKPHTLQIWHTSYTQGHPTLVYN